MAKIVEVSYGLTNINSKKLYKYVVNDNIKRGSVLAPVVKHYKSGKNFTTMAVVQKSQGGKNGMTEKEFQNLMNETNGRLTIANPPTKAMQQALRTTNAKGQYVYTGEHGFSKKTDNFADGMVRVGNGPYENNKTSQAVQTERTNIANNVSYIQAMPSVQGGNAAYDNGQRTNQSSNGSYQTYDDYYASKLKGVKL